MTPPAQAKNRPERRDCRRCRHYFVTWDPQTPHGCRIMGFKSRFSPYLQVFRVSGQNCQSFSPKAK